MCVLACGCGASSGGGVVILFSIVTAVITSIVGASARVQVCTPTNNMGRCRTCGYDLHGLEREGVCPECGAAYAPIEPVVHGERRITQECFCRAAVGMALYFGAMMAIEPLAGLIVAIDYRLDGWSWQIAWSAPLKRELAYGGAMSVMSPLAITSAFLPLVGHAGTVRGALRFVLALIVAGLLLSLASD